MKHACGFRFSMCIVLALLTLCPARLLATVAGNWAAYGPGAIVASGRLNSIAFNADKSKMFISFSKRFAADASSQVWQCVTGSLTFSALDNTNLPGATPMWVRIATAANGEPVCVSGPSGPMLYYDGSTFQTSTLPAGETTNWNTGQGGSFVKLTDGSLLFLARYSVLKSTNFGATFTSICDTRNYTQLPAPFGPDVIVYAPTYLTNAPYYSYYGYNFLFTRLPWGELVIAGESPGFFHSLDDGLTWENINPGYYQAQRDATGVPWYLDRRFLLTMGGNLFGCGYNKEGELVLSEDPLNGVSIFRQHACGITAPMMNGLPPNIAGFGAPPQTNRAGEVFFWTGYSAGNIPTGRPPNDIYAWDGTAWNVVSTALGQGPIYTSLLGVDGMDIYAASGPGIRKFTSSATNLPPLVDLGAQQTVTYPNAATLTAQEDLPGPWQHEWTARQGWAVRFSAPDGQATQAHFAAPGDYVINCQSFNGVVRGGNSVIVHVLPAIGAVAPGIQTHPANATLVPGNGASFTVVPSPASTGPLTYQWFQEGQPIPGATSPTLNTVPLTLQEEGATFGCWVMGPGGKVFSNSGTVGRPPVIVEPPASQNVAAGQSVDFTVSASGVMPMQWEWYDNGLPISGVAGHQAKYTIASASAAQDGHQYSVKVTNLFGSVISSAATLNLGSAATQLVRFNPPAVGSESDGHFAPGSRVAISAPVWQPAMGGYFTGWIISGGGVIAQPSQTATYVTLPGSVGGTIFISPQYSSLGSYILSVVNGTANGTFAVGATIPLKAAAPPPGFVFDHWSGVGGVTFTNANAPSTTAQMPGGDARAVANYIVNPAVELSVFE